MTRDETPQRTTGRVLVIDDHPLLVTAIERLLADWQVTPTTSSREALARLQAGEEFDVVLCDLVMPEFTGMDLFQAIAAVRPDVADRFVFMTGGAFTVTAETFLDQVPNARLEKPVSPDLLRDTLAKVVVSGRSRRDAD